jgi:O-antigen ligase
MKYQPLHQWGIINTPTQGFGTFLSYVLVVLLTALPIFFFSIGGSTTRIAIATYLVCLIALVFNAISSDKSATNYPKLYWWVIFSLWTYFLATGISQIANQSFVPNRLDAPSRLVFSGLIFYAVYHYRINFIKILKVAVPISIILFLLFLTFKNDQIVVAKNMWGGRLSLPFIDPILLSAWLTCFGLLCLSFINIQFKASSILKNTFFIATFITTIYIALITESRNSWFAIPLLASILIFKQPNKWLKIGFILFTTICIFYLINHVSSSLTRIDQAILEIKNYFNGTAKETSVGIRIDMGMLAFKALSLKPIFGWSENLFITPEIDNHLAMYYTPSTIFLAKYTGFHNDFYAAIVRSGSLGAFAFVTTLLTPLIVFIGFLFKGNASSRPVCFNGLAVIITCIIASMTAEILSYKYSVSLFGYLIAGIMAHVLWQNQEDNF